MIAHGNLIGKQEFSPYIVEALFDGLATHLGGWCGAIGAENTPDGGVFCEMEIFLPPESLARARETDAAGSAGHDRPLAGEILLSHGFVPFRSSPSARYG